MVFSFDLVHKWNAHVLASGFLLWGGGDPTFFRTLAGKAPVDRFSNCQMLLIGASGNPRTTAHTLRLDKRFIQRHGDVHELRRDHISSILSIKKENCSILNIISVKS